MGIRIKLLGSLMGLVLIPLIGTQTWLSWRLNSSYTHLEFRAVQEDFQRLLVAIDAQLLQHEKLVNDWANWSEFADYARTGQGPFARDNLDREAVAASGFAWLAVLQRDGRLLYSVSASGTDPSAVLASPYGPPLRTLPQDNARSCGLARWEQQWMAFCRQGIRPGSGVGEPQGLLVVAEPLPDNFQAHLSSLTGLSFALLPDPLPTVEGSKAGAALTSRLGQAPAHYRVDSENIQAWWPVRDMLDQPVGHLALDWPRAVSRQARNDLGTVQWQLLGFFVLITVGLLVLLDRWVVRRLVRFSQELRSIHARERWKEQITVDGHDEITQLAQETNTLLGLIHFQMENLELLADSDGLTGLPNRRSFDETLQRALATHRRYQRPFCLVVLDVDHFKAYNDHYGHAQGDVALKTVAQCLLAQAKRPGDLPARIGGEEFAVILEDTALPNAEQWLRGLQARLQALALPHEHSPVAPCLTLSAGLTSALATDTSDSLFQRADAALYQAKLGGRNRYVVAPA